MGIKMLLVNRLSEITPAPFNIFHCIEIVLSLTVPPEIIVPEPLGATLQLY